MLYLVIYYEMGASRIYLGAIEGRSKSIRNLTAASACKRIKQKASFFFQKQSQQHFRYLNEA